MPVPDRQRACKVRTARQDPPASGARVLLESGDELYASSLQLGDSGASRGAQATDAWLYRSPLLLRADAARLLDDPRHLSLQGVYAELEGARSNGRGRAEGAEVAQDGSMALEGLELAFCGGDGEGPGWGLEARRLLVDQEYVVAEGVRLVLAGVRLPRFSRMRIRRDSGGASGLLMPQVALRDERGLELAIPWHWAMAGNMDLTLTARAAEKIDGLGMEAEYRYRTRRAEGSLEGLGMGSRDGDWNWLRWRHRALLPRLRLAIDWVEGKRLELLHRHPPASLAADLWNSQPQVLDMQARLGRGFSLRAWHRDYLPLDPGSGASGPRREGRGASASLELVNQGSAGGFAWRARLAEARLDRSALLGSGADQERQRAALRGLGRANLDLWARYRQEWGAGGWSAQVSSRTLEYRLGEGRAAREFDLRDGTRRHYANQGDGQAWAKAWLNLRGGGWRLQPWVAATLARDSDGAVRAPWHRRLRFRGALYDLPPGQAADDFVAQPRHQGAGVSLARSLAGGWTLRAEAAAGVAGQARWKLELADPRGLAGFSALEERGEGGALARTSRLEAGRGGGLRVHLDYREGWPGQPSAAAAAPPQRPWRQLGWGLRVPWSASGALRLELSRNLRDGRDLLGLVGVRLRSCCLELDAELSRTARPNYNSGPGGTDPVVVESGLSVRLRLKY